MDHILQVPLTCIAAWSCDQMFANDPERAEMGAKCEKRLGNLMWIRTSFLWNFIKFSISSHGSMWSQNYFALCLLICQQTEYEAFYNQNKIKLYFSAPSSNSQERQNFSNTWIMANLADLFVLFVNIENAHSCVLGAHLVNISMFIRGE